MILILFNFFLLVATFVTVGNLYKQFGPKSGSKLFATLIVFLIDFFEKITPYTKR